MEQKFVAFAWCTVALASVLVPSARAQACSFIDCYTVRVFPEAGDLPVDRVEFRITYTNARATVDAGEALPRLYRLEGQTKVALAFDALPSSAGDALRVVPRESLAVGTQLAVESDPSADCALPTRVQTFRISEARALPSPLGILRTSTHREAIEVAVSNGSCDGWVDAAYADVELTLAEGATAYAAVLRYQLIVDGEPRAPFASSLPTLRERNGAGSLPRGQDRLFALCDSDTTADAPGALAAGKHRVRVAARIGDDFTFETPEVEVELSCAGAEPHWPSGATPYPARGSQRDAAVPTADVPVPTADGPVPTADRSVAAQTVEADDGCALATSHHASGAWVLSLLGLLARAQSTRARRRSKPV